MGMIASTKQSGKGFSKLTEMFGIERGHWRPEHRQWGKTHAIQFLNDLANVWGETDNMYGQIDDYGDFEPILLGDISVEGGQRHQWDKMTDHKSHLSGVDIDIYIFRNGQHVSEKQRSIGTDTYDYARTKELSKLIFELGSTAVKMVFFDDTKLINEVKATGVVAGRFFGPDTGRPAHGDSPAVPPTPHRDHMHVRLNL